jgi:hypothetical protein
MTGFALFYFVSGQHFVVGHHAAGHVIAEMAMKHPDADVIGHHVGHSHKKYLDIPPGGLATSNHLKHKKLVFRPVEEGIP